MPSVVHHKIQFASREASWVGKISTEYAGGGFEEEVG